ncbi:unnamed protein product, partial [marine sediment metagenome]
PHRRCIVPTWQQMHFMRQLKTIKAKREPQKAAVKSKEKIAANAKDDKNRRQTADYGYG